MKITLRPLVPALIILVSFAFPKLVTERWIFIAVLTLYYMILSTGWNIIAGYTGRMSFATAGFSSLGAYTSALLVVNLKVPILLGIAVAMAVAFAVGYGLGVIVLRLRGPYLAMTTLAFAQIFTIVVTVEWRYTRGGLGLPTPRLFTGTSYVPYYYTFLLLFLALVGITYLIMRSKIGLFLRAIRDDDEAASAMGISVVKWTLFAFALSSLYAGLAGALYAHMVFIVTPTIGHLSEMGIIIVMTVVGGSGTIVGPIVGAIIVETVSELLREFQALQVAVFAALLVIVIRFFREGIVGVFVRRISRTEVPAAISPVPTTLHRTMSASSDKTLQNNM